MPTFADLPSDIIVAIISLQRADNEVVSDWKHSLRILSICHSWRAAILPVVYATVFFIIPEDFLESYLSQPQRLPFDYNVPRTNAGLIYENGYGFMVKHMCVHTVISTVSPFPWLYVTEALDADNDRFPELEAVRKWIEIDTNTIYKSVEQISACINALSPIAHVLALRFPNVSSMDILGDIGYNSQIDVTSILVSTYSSQLVKVDVRGRKVNPSYLMAANIRYFAINVFNNESYIGYTTPTPYINPKSLVCLRLHCDIHKNIWNNFVCDNDTHSIEFTNLEILQLTCAKLNEGYDFDSIKWRLKFPKLAHLKIDCGMFTNSNFHHWALNLKTLEYKGVGYDAIDHLKSNFGSLEKVHLILPMDAFYEHSVERFTSDTNKIFSTVGPIPEVSCTGLEACFLQLSRIYWPNLTWLELTTSIEPYEFLCSIDRIPHLQHLYLIISRLPYFENEIEDSGENAGVSGNEEYTVRDRSIRPNWYSIELSRLSLLKRSEQSQSKLATLSIQWSTVNAYNYYPGRGSHNQFTSKGPSLETIINRQSRSQSKCPFSKYDSIRYNYNWDDLNVPICKNPMEDAEADAALRTYCPNLVITKFAYMTAKDTPAAARFYG